MTGTTSEAASPPQGDRPGPPAGAILCRPALALAAIQLTSNVDWAAVAAWCGGYVNDPAQRPSEVPLMPPCVVVPTAYGTRCANEGDWVVEGTEAFMVLSDAEFRAVYEPVPPEGERLIIDGGTNDGLDYLTDAAEPVPPPLHLARVEVKGFRDLGVVALSETTLAGEPMLRAEGRDGSVAEFPASSVHFISRLPAGSQWPADARRQAITAGHPVDDGYWDGDDDDDPFGDNPF